MIENSSKVIIYDFFFLGWGVGDEWWYNDKMDFLILMGVRVLVWCINRMLMMGIIIWVDKKNFKIIYMFVFFDEYFFGFKLLNNMFYD